jgi:hypothetical protein
LTVKTETSSAAGGLTGWIEQADMDTMDMQMTIKLAGLEKFVLKGVGMDQTLLKNDKKLSLKIHMQATQI